MAGGDLTASTPVVVNESEIKATIDTLNLAEVTDKLFVLPVPGRDNQVVIFKVEREAD